MKLPDRVAVRRIAGALAGLCLAGAFWSSLPEFDAPLSATLYAADGSLIGASVASDGQWRFAVPEQVPAKLATAITQAEDGRFFAHPGVDPVAVLRAAWTNVQAGRVVAGGSTLTMQLVRLARDNPSRTFAEKLVEAILALRLEVQYSKRELLSFYAAYAPYGGNVVGVEAAAWRYFGHAPSELSWAEASTLAVLPNNPALVHPGRGRERLKAKRDRLLAKLNAEGFVDDLTLELSLREPLPDAPRPFPRLAPHLLDTLAARDGARAHSVTLSRSLQKAVAHRVDVAAEKLGAQGVHNAAALVISNRDLEVVAYAGNRRASSDTERGFAVDLVPRHRSTGSLLKPFLFAAMVQDGLLAPSSLVPDVPMVFTGFRPENFDRSYKGAVRAREALAQSLNVPAVFMLRGYGVAHFHDVLKRLGMTTLFRAPDGYGLTLVLGGAEGTLWDLAQMYANLARIAQSTHQAPALGKLRISADEPLEEIGVAPIGPGAAYLTLDALQEVNRPDLDRHWKNFSSSRKLAWKTGTSPGMRDGWAIGVTPRYTVAVWAGNASGEGQAGLTGAAMAAPLMFDILDELDDTSWFAPPMFDLQQVSLCRADGYLPQGGCATERAWLPLGGRFQQVSHHHRRVHLDATGSWRVDSRCEPTDAMRHETWFVLPPAQEYFFRVRDTSYRTLPRYRKDCAAAAAEEGERPFEIVYPDGGAQIYIPDDLGGIRSRVVFEAVQRSQGQLYWHLDDAYLAATGPFHRVPVDIAPGAHVLTVVDQNGYRIVRKFTVLSKQARAPEAQS